MTPLLRLNFSGKRVELIRGAYVTAILFGVNRASCTRIDNSTLLKTFLINQCRKGFKFTLYVADYEVFSFKRKLAVRGIKHPLMLLLLP